MTMKFESKPVNSPKVQRITDTLYGRITRFTLCLQASNEHSGTSHFTTGLFRSISILFLFLGSFSLSSVYSKDISEVLIVATDNEFNHKTLVVRSGRNLPIRFVNDGKVEHNIVVDGYGEQTKITAMPGKTAQSEWDLVPGRYSVFCDIRGHRSTMDMTLIVTE